ncbi:MAG TPA: thermonuclease family protein [Sphingomicrobium sp.]|nr:thermonuclease family protein [Sphingomicrobium sp.]
MRTSWHSATGPRPQLPAYLRQSKRLKGLDEWQDPPWKQRTRRLSGRAKAGLILVGAVALGIGAGAVLSWREAPPAAPKVFAPDAVALDPRALAPPPEEADGEWAARGEMELAPPAAAPSGSSDRIGAVRASFSYCKWGGGTNCVVDGDTFFIGGAKVRIAGIDAPETHDYRCKSELALGDRATAQLQALLNSGAVTMTSIDRDRDRYGRLLRNVAVNGQDVGEALISASVARAYAGGRRSWC